ncbi:glycosyltransferase family 4 protein [Rhodococcoides kroppenstedtii]|uniref:glycosyltransferase family 4 protein n=1 Tax=Rhodococcoides kroppenstedtii TaxID=293050 RepID=UPI0036257851
MSFEDGPIVRRGQLAGLSVSALPLKGDARLDMKRHASVFALLRSLAQLGPLVSRLRMLIREDGSEIVVARSVKALVVAKLATIGWPSLLVWSVHDRVSADYFGTGMAVLVRTFGRVAADAYVANSQSTLQSIRCGRKPRIVVSPGVELEVFNGGSRDSTPASVVRVVMVGRFAPWKGQDLLMTALAPILIERDDVHLTFVGAPLFGEDSFFEHVQSLAAQVPDGRVAFAGHLQDTSAMVKTADIAVHCSRLPEPFGAVIVEAMASGCAVVASDGGGPSEIIEHNVDGLLVERDSVEALRASLLRLIEEPDFRRELGERATESSKRFGMGSVSQEYSSWLKGLK